MAMNFRNMMIAAILLLLILLSLGAAVVTFRLGYGLLVTMSLCFVSLQIAACTAVWLWHAEKDCLDAMIDDLTDALDQEEQRAVPDVTTLAVLKSMMLLQSRQCEQEAQRLQRQGQLEQARITAESGLYTLRLWQWYSRLTHLHLRLVLAIASGRVLVLESGSGTQIAMDWSLAAVRIGFKLREVRQILQGTAPGRQLENLTEDLLLSLPRQLKVFDRLLWVTWLRSNEEQVGSWSNYCSDLGAMHEALAALESVV